MKSSLFLRQIWTLAWKDLLLLLNPKRRTFTIIRSGTFPTIFIVYIAFIIRVYWPKEVYGIGNPATIRSLPEAISQAPGNRRTLVLCNYGPRGGDIDKVIEQVAATARQGSENKVEILTDPNDLLTTCRSSLQGVTKCYAAAEFHSSPTEGGLWNYTIRVDGTFGYKINVENNNNDAEIFPLPLQHAIDAAIAYISSGAGSKPLPNTIKAQPYTSKTQDEWDDSLVTSIQNANAKYIAVVWYIGFIGLSYQLVGLVAKERELGMAELLESMMPNAARWQPQAARLLGHWIAFTIVYFPSWILMAILAKVGVFPKTSPGILIIFFLLTGLSLNSFSILGASIFRRAQLSGITVTVVALVLGVAAQIPAKTLSTGAVAILSLLFTPMTFVFHMIWLARYENKQISPNLVQAAPGATWRLPGLVFWIFMLVQIFAYPVLAAFVERAMFYTDSRGRRVTYDDDADPVVLSHFTRHYQPNWFFRYIAPFFGVKKPVIKAVNDVSLAPVKGQIVLLVGANGCGKSTTLNAIAGIGDVTSGSICVNGCGGIGICPQRNVLWDHLTVAQHAQIFNRIKSTTINPSVESELDQLIYECDLSRKKKAYSYTLSGGQKRKLQLVMMLTGGSRVCCVDEVSGGLDPVSRRKIWDILLAARGTRTIILTTHFLDEAEFLADHMVIMTKGSVKAEGSVSQLKTKLGSGYRFHFLHGAGYSELPDVEDLFVGAPKESLFDQTIFTVSESTRMTQIIKELEKRGIRDFQVTGSTIEEVFMKLAGETEAALSIETSESTLTHDLPIKAVSNEGKALVDRDEPLTTGKPLGFMQQSVILFKKRAIVLKRNYLPYTFAFLIPVIATALISLLLKDKKYAGCSAAQQISESEFETLETNRDYKPLLLLGPTNAFTEVNLGSLQTILPNQFQGAKSSLGALQEYVSLVDSFDDYQAYLRANFSKVTPGGFFLGQEPVFSFYSNLGFLGLYSGIFMQNIVDVLLTNTTIVTSFRSFSYPWPSDTTNQIQFIFYFGLIMSCYPAFFALYPTRERLRKIRELQYSNGARPLPLWLAYLSFDWLNVLVASGLMTIILVAAAGDNWWNVGYLFVVLFLYGLASLLWAYLVALFAKSQLAAFAIAAGTQAFLLLMYFTGVMNIQSNMEASKVNNALTIFNYTFNLIAPSGNLARALFISMNLFGTLCRGTPPRMASYPGEIGLYGAPIAYLLGQSLLMFTILLIVDHGWTAKWFHKTLPAKDGEDHTTLEKEVADEITRVEHSNDGLRAQHLSREYKSPSRERMTVVDDLTFGIDKGEVFAMCGPNGAGKSTTIGMLRGEILPSRAGASIHIGPVDALRDRRAARARLGVCPQFDAVDQMSVLEHLEFYAGVRGIPSSCVTSTAEQLIRAVGLERFENRMASKLSGGNKRKLSLAIALIGNPDVVLLDEPSSGMDPVAKRGMWEVLRRFVAGRSVLLTTHSMEEADHLATRVCVVASGRMLDIGTTSHLRRKHGHGFHIQLICASAPHTTSEEMEQVKAWVEETLPGSQMEGFAYHGQLRFNVPAKRLAALGDNIREKRVDGVDDSAEEEEELTVGQLFVLLEEHKERLGLEFYSVSPSTFDEVFLRVIEKHDAGEEPETPKRKKDWKYWVGTVLRIWLLIPRR
ncbi:putative ABC transporter [Westerdykella ornata]|uniref:Putative ABC transporter n=1 Tax=Westerdykella ornata TaxID=318751 RepID=A0A6A6JAH4_WESOR|nr:putative ABC transporter [Westerdykella ornata]KAF2273591.1 putative ABC transporter [Westerdykella ornata]